MSEGLFSSLYQAGVPFALIDTRERRDYVNGHWFGSTNVPLSVLSDRITRLIPDRNFPIHLLDWGDVASRAAADHLTRLGYRAVISCPSSPRETDGAGFVRGEFTWSKAFGEVVAHACGLPEVTPKQYLATYTDAMLFDVRPTAEYGAFTIPGSDSLPNSLLMANIDKLRATGRPALLHCAGRTRSIIGACTLHAAGYDGEFAIFKGGTQAWQLDGHEREFGADRVFAHETADTDAAKTFLTKWGIGYQTQPRADLSAVINDFGDAHLFDVSDDAAKGVPVAHGASRISGTNLIQQTDRSIARYHVPVVLFDHGSGSRAAFAAFWLSKMGFDVSVVFLDGALAIEETLDQGPAFKDRQTAIVSESMLLPHRDAGWALVDVRSSRAYADGHLKGAVWGNVSAAVAGDMPPPPCQVAVIADTEAQGRASAAILSGCGWQIAGIAVFSALSLPQAELEAGDVADPIDQCALFAERHHGNMQDSRDYLAWEEELPDHIDAKVHSLWHDLLKPVFTPN